MPGVIVVLDELQWIARPLLDRIGEPRGVAVERVRVEAMDDRDVDIGLAVAVAAGGRAEEPGTVDRRPFRELLGECIDQARPQADDRCQRFDGEVAAVDLDAVGATDRRARRKPALEEVVDDLRDSRMTSPLALRFRASSAVDGP